MASIADTKSIKIEEGKATTIEFEKEQANTKSGFMYCTPGIDSPPLKDDKILTVQIPGKEKFIAIGNLLIGSGAESGEIIVFSRDSSGEIQGKMYIKKDGNFVFNDGTDNAVRYSILESAFNQLKQDFNNLVSVFNSHTQTVSGTVAAAPVTPGIPSTADISNAKIDDIKFPEVGV